MSSLRKGFLYVVFGLFVWAVSACASPAETPLPVLPTATALPPIATIAPTATALPPTFTTAPTAPAAKATAASPTFTAAPTASGGGQPDEAILILEPGPGSRLVSPIRVAGLADPAFEQTLVVRILLDDGTVLRIEPTIIQADVGQRGPFAVDVPAAISQECQAFIQVYASSPRDGSITHLTSVGVTLLPAGQSTVVPATPHPERIVIKQPALNAALSGGIAHVEGWALASFEGTLIVDVLDEAGNVVGSQPLVVRAPDVGQPGPFSVDVPYNVATQGPGTIVVRDPSVVFVGDVHRASVVVILGP